MDKVNITRLDIFENNFGADGMVCISHALSVAPNLVYLDISRCNLQIDGTIILVEAL